VVSVEILLRGGRRQLVSQPWLAWSAATGALAGTGAALLRLPRLLRSPGRRLGEPRAPLPTLPRAPLANEPLAPLANRPGARLPTVRGSR
jgi:hypothetical protein